MLGETLVHVYSDQIIQVIIIQNLSRPQDLKVVIVIVTMWIMESYARILLIIYRPLMGDGHTTFFCQKNKGR
jgi:hypothetical protein